MVQGPPVHVIVMVIGSSSCTLLPVLLKSKEIRCTPLPGTCSVWRGTFLDFVD